MSEEIRILILEDVPNDAVLAIREVKKSITNCSFKEVDNKQDFLDAIIE
jgi:hypothetical protein